MISAEDGYITLGIVTGIGDMHQMNVKYVRKGCTTGRLIVWEVSETLRNHTHAVDYHGDHIVEKEQRTPGQDQ